MKKLTFKYQILLGIIFILLGNVLAFIFHHGIFTNLAWILYGLLFIVHPVCPERFTESGREKQGILAVRIAGAVCIIIGLLVWFYP